MTLSSGQTIFSSKKEKDNSSQTVVAQGLESVVCPVHWAAGTHQVTCSLAFPPDYDEHANPPIEVGGNTPYYRAIAGESFKSFSLFLSDR
jgi:hypothetical protein